MQVFNILSQNTKMIRTISSMILRYKQLKLWQRFVCLFMVSVLLTSVLMLALPPQSVFAATGEIVPNNDVATQWTAVGSNNGSCTSGTHCPKVSEARTSPLTTGLIDTSGVTSGGEVEDFNMSTLTNVQSVSSITLYMYARDSDGVAQGSTFDDIDMNINIGGASQTASRKTMNSATWAWHSATFNGSWSQANLDGVRATFTRIKQGSGNPTAQSDTVQIATVYMSVTYTQNITYEQSAYRFYANADSTNVGSTLAALNTAMTNAQTPAQGTPFRLRMLMHVGSGTLSLSGQSFRLQYAQTATCSSGSYSNITLTTPIAYYNNATPVDGAALTINGNDPTHSGHTVRAQTYEEQFGFTNSVSSVSPNEDALWDFSLVVTAGASENTSYCVRIVTSAGATLSTYSQYPRLTTQVRSLEQSSYRWFEDKNSVDTSLQTEGNQIIGAQISSFGDDNAGTVLKKYTFGSPVVISNVFAAVNASSGTNTSVQGGIYSDQAGYPGTRIKISSNIIVGQTSFAYENFNFNPTLLEPGTYWIGVIGVGESTGVHRIAYDNGGAADSAAQNINAPYDFILEDWDLSIYINYHYDLTSDISPLNSINNNLDTTSISSQKSRLRAGVHADGHGIAAGEAFKLQYAERGSDLMCDPSGTGESYQDVSSPLGVDWTKATGASNLFSARYQNSMASFKGDLYVFGGVSAGTTYRTDALYKSTDDGVTWSHVTMTGTAPTARRSQSMLVFDDKLWVIGGESSGYLDDVYSSSDGTNWTRVRTNGAGSGFGGRMEHGAVVYNNKLWVMGGYNGAWLSTVYSSTDGASWAAETSMPAGLANFGYSVKDNKIWITGGTSSGIAVEDDVLSFNGTSWTTESSNPLFNPVYGHVQLTLDDKLWVIAGDPSTETTSDELNFVYASSDGITWSEVTLDAGFSARQLIGGTVHNDYQMYIAGGYDGVASNEVWVSGVGVIASESTGFMTPSTVANDSSVGTAPWNNLNDAQVEDYFGAYSVSDGISAVSNYIYASGFNFNIPANATIVGIQAQIGRQSSSSSTITDNRVSLVKAGVVQSQNKADSGYYFTSGFDTVSYGSASDLWGETWLASDINNSSFGIALSVQFVNEFDQADIDFMAISINYTTTQGAFTFYDNTAIKPGSRLASSVDDPTHSGHTNVMQSYVEQNNFTALNGVEPGQDAVWGFSLAYYGPLQLRQSYCFRIVEADGSPLDTYTVVPQLTIAPAPLQLMRTGRYWSDGQEQPFAL